MRSEYGNWESRGPLVDAVLWTVAHRHQLVETDSGYACLCSAHPTTARGGTEHIIDETMTALVDAEVFPGASGR